MLSHVIVAIISQLASILCNELLDEDDNQEKEEEVETDDDSTNFGPILDL